jgi:hypothetical protein
MKALEMITTQQAFDNVLDFLERHPNDKHYDEAAIRFLAQNLGLDVDEGRLQRITQLVAAARKQASSEAPAPAAEAPQDDSRRLWHVGRRFRGYGGNNR